jgi:hypothetical protein
MVEPPEERNKANMNRRDGFHHARLCMFGTAKPHQAASFQNTYVKISDRGEQIANNLHLHAICSTLAH